MTSSAESGIRRKTGSGTSSHNILVRLRHRAPLLPATLKGNTLIFKTPVKTPAPGQSAVFYSSTTCLGGGIII